MKLEQRELFAPGSFLGTRRWRSIGDGSTTCNTPTCFAVPHTPRFSFQERIYKELPAPTSPARDHSTSSIFNLATIPFVRKHLAHFATAQ